MIFTFSHPPIVSADTYTRVYTPPYWDAIKWATALVPYVSGGRAGCNSGSGSVGIYAAGWIGGGTATATQYVNFYVPTKSSIKAKVRIVYGGGTVNFGFASFSGTEWQWNLDNGSFHRHDISPPFSWDIVLGKIIDIVLLIAPELAPEESTAAEIIELFDAINTVYGMASTMEQLIESGDATDMTKSFTFTADYGNHVLGVGIRGTATGVVTGSGFAIMGGFIPSVTLEISNDCNGSADLTIGDVDLSDNYPIRGKQIQFQTIINNIGKGYADNDKVKFIIDEPGKPNAFNYTSGDCYNFAPATTIVRNFYYTPKTKGYLTFKAIADPLNEIVESDETNNEMDKTFYVKGLPPNKPSKPSGLPLGKTLTRNTTYTFTTSTTDPDGDAVKYSFRIKPEGASWFFVPGWDTESEGWNDGSVDFTPTIANAMGFPGTYYITAEAIDSDGMYSGESDSEVFWVAPNFPPSAPFITGPTSGYTVDTLTFSAYSSDAENDPVQYRFNWGDGTPVTNWTSTSTGHSTISVSHNYSTAGTYNFQVQAEDSNGVTSSWSSQSVKITVYVPPPGDIEVISTISAASFSIYKSGSLTFTGSGAYWDSGGTAPGYYSIVFNAVDGYFTPPNESDQLFSNGYITFNGCYAHKTGTIHVSTNNALASFTVTGYDTAIGQSFTGNGMSWTKSDSWVGEHVISFGSIAGYCMPYENRTHKTLGNLETVTFTGTYLLPPIAHLDFYTTHTWVLAGEDAILFNGTSSINPNTGVGISKYFFNFGDGSTPYYETPTFAPDGQFDGKTTHCYAQSGKYTPNLTVYDPYGNGSSKYYASQITVKGRPRAKIYITPAPAICGETVSFYGSGTDPDGDAIIGYEWNSDISGLLSTSANFSKDDLTTGSHVITLKVKDSDNLWSLDERFYLLNYDPRNWKFFKNNPPRLSAQPPYWGRLYGLLPYGIKWLYPTAGAIIGSPVAANIDGNWKNGLEIAFTSQDGNLYVLDNGGNFLWSKNIGASSTAPAVDSLSTTGSLCVVASSPNGVYAFNNIGTQLWHFNSTPAGITFNSSPVIADIDNNPHNGKETVIACDDGNIYAIDSGGNKRWNYNVPGATFTGSPAVADVDPQRPGMETAIGSMNGNLYLIDANGNLITSWAPAAPAQIHTTPAIAQLVPNTMATGGMETNIVFGADTGRVYCLWYTTGTLSLAWEYPAAANPALQPVRSSPAIGTVGEYSSVGGEVVFGCDDGTVYDLRGNDGVIKTAYNCGVGVMVQSTPVIANIDTIHFLHPQKGDLPEVIFGASNGNLYTVSLAQGPQNLPGSPYPLAPLLPILSSAAVCDINHDPDMEIIIGSTNGTLYMLAPMKNPALVPAANFSADHTTGNAPLSVTFTDLSTNTPIQWYWDFGDDYTTNTAHPTHTYDMPGSYTVTLFVTNEHGTGTTTKTGYIIVSSPPVTAFDCTPASGFASLDVHFTDQSQYSPTSWSWTFGDTGTSNKQNPSHTYTSPGTYTVSLTATNANGSNMLTKTDCILVLTAPPVADFTQDVTDGKAPLSVNFTDLSTGYPASWDWSFGDGGTSNAQNPSHSYTRPGDYLVTLTVTNAGGSDTKTNSVLISVESQTESVLIPGVPDINQPPTKTLPSTTQTNFCAPIAAVNITEYWDYIIKDTNALAVDATLSSPTVAEYVGYFMDTNNDGSKDRGNDTDNHNGTFIKDEAVGLTEFVRWDATHPYNTPPATPPALPPFKAGYVWETTTDYTVGWNFYKNEINASRPALVNFSFWNPLPTDISVVNTATGEEINVYIWGGEISDSQSANPSNPEENWNLQTSENCIGHTVTGVGYIENWDPDDTGPLPESNFLIVHDTWDTTPKNVAIPWQNWNATIKVKAIKTQTSVEPSWLLY